MKDKAKKTGKQGWRSRIVGHEKMSPLALVSNPKNFKAHPDHQRKALLKVIDDVGFVRSVTVNKSTGTIIDGHLRVALAVQQKQPLIDVELIELTKAEEGHVLATLDPIGGLAEVDDLALNSLLMELEEKKQKGKDGLPASLKRLSVKAPPKMVYALIGIEISKFGEIAELIEKAALVPGAYVKSTVSNEIPKEN